MPCSWEGNCRSGIALAMHHGSEWFIHLWTNGLRKGDEHSTSSLHGVWCTLPLQTNHLHTQHCVQSEVTAYCLPCYDTKCYFNVRLKADISQLNLPHGMGHSFLWLSR